jgi:hypothetical protein
MIHWVCVCVYVCVEFAGLLEMVLLARPACMDTQWLSQLAVGECVIKNKCEWIWNRNSAIPGPTLWLPPQLLTLCCRLVCWNGASLWSSLCILYQIYQLPKALVDLWFRALAQYYFKFLLDFWFFFFFSSTKFSFRFFCLFLPCIKRHHAYSTNCNCN